MTSRLLACGLFLVIASNVAAQPLGTFRWQLQPFCNVVTLNVTQQGGIYTVDGFDDQCGAGTRGGITGTGVPNPNGTVGLNFTVVTSPGGGPVHVSGQLSLATLGGVWQDSSGHAGTLAFNQATSGAARPAPGPTAIYILPGFNFVGGFATLTIPVSAEASNRSVWDISMTSAANGREYSIPGLGFGGATNYRVSVEPGATQTTIYIDKTGPGENYTAIRVVRTTR